MKWIVGIDEVGRGPLAGPMTVGVFAIPYDQWKSFNMYARRNGLTDSKKLSERARVAWTDYFKKAKKEQKCIFTTVSVSPHVLDNQGMTKSAHAAIARALQRLQLPEEQTIVKLDGLLKAPDTFMHQEVIIGGDAKHMAIAAASVTAKVTRDAYMVRQAGRFPEYGFELHKGYGTKKHIMAIRKHGFCPLHRRTFCRRIDVA